MRIIFKLTAVLLILSGCTNIDRSVEKSRLEANDYRLFQGTEVERGTTAVQEALIKANIPISPPHYENNYMPISTSFGIVDILIGTKITYEICIIPSIAFKRIQEANPKGSYYHK